MEIKAEEQIRNLLEPQFKEIIKYIPAVQHDVFYLVYYLGIPVSDIVRIKGDCIHEDGIRTKRKKYPWFQDADQDLRFIKQRLIETAQKFPSARLFEAQKPIFKAEYDLVKAFQKGVDRYHQYQTDLIDNVEGRLPDFLVLGTPKSATTWLYQCLKDHPSIFLPEKELEFFGGYRFYYGINWYRKQFLDCRPDQVAGDVSIGYFQSPEAPKRIFDLLDHDHLKLIVLLREPIDRALSFYEMRVLKGNLLSSFEESIRVPYYRNLYIESGHYDQFYQNYLGFFPKEQILILLHEEIKANSHKVLNEVFNFIGVQQDLEPQFVNRKTNVGRSIKNPKMHYYLTNLGYLFQVAIPKFGLGFRIRKMIMKLSFRINFYRIRKDYVLDPLIRSNLESEFRPSNEHLSALSGVELGDNWKY